MSNDLSGIDFSKPSPARVYDLSLDGKEGREVDRQLFEQLRARIPEAPAASRANRRLLQRMTRHLVAEAGITQILDLGAGLPTQGNTHEIAHQINPSAKVVYVDNDPEAVTHGLALLGGPNVTAMEGDLCEPEAIFADPEVLQLLDPTQPIAVLLIAVLHMFPEERDPYGIVARIRDMLPSGSYIAVSHLMYREDEPEKSEAAMEVYRPFGFTLRTHEQTLRFFDGLGLVEPGLVTVTEWRPDGNERPDPEFPDAAEWLLGGLGRKS